MRKGSKTFCCSFFPTIVLVLAVFKVYSDCDQPLHPFLSVLLRAFSLFAHSKYTVL